MPVDIIRTGKEWVTINSSEKIKKFVKKFVLWNCEILGWLHSIWHWKKSPNTRTSAFFFRENINHSFKHSTCKIRKKLIYFAQNSGCSFNRNNPLIFLCQMTKASSFASEANFKKKKKNMTVAYKRSTSWKEVQLR